VPTRHLEPRRACTAQRRIGDHAIRIEAPLREQPLHGARDVRDVHRDPIKRRQVLLADRRLVENRPQQAHEVSLFGRHDVRERLANRPVRTGHRELKLFGGEGAASLEELLVGPRAVPHLPQKEVGQSSVPIVS
jgi:hypothetical protein